MIVGGFDDQGRPFVEGRLALPSLRVDRSILFLLDTGADITCLHTRDSRRAQIPFNALRSRTYTRGIGGASLYFRETAIISFSDGPHTRYYVVELHIAEPNEANEELALLAGPEHHQQVVHAVRPSQRQARLHCALRRPHYWLTDVTDADTPIVTSHEDNPHHNHTTSSRNRHRGVLNGRRGRCGRADGRTDITPSGRRPVDPNGCARGGGRADRAARHGEAELRAQVG